MVKKLVTLVLSVVLTAAVILGAYLGLVRFFGEAGGKNVELVVDLKDLKKMAAFEKKPLGPVLDEVRKIGISRIGVFEETLPEAGALGEIYYAKGSGVIRLKGFLSNLQISGIKPDATYIYAPDLDVMKRIYDQLKWALGAKTLQLANNQILEVDEPEEELRGLGLGISEAQRKFLEQKGFTIVPRVWHDPRYHLGNLDAKMSALNGCPLVIFDGDKIIGSPDAIPALAAALKKYKIKYGAIEIVKQDGDKKLRKLMGQDAIRVHSVPKDELEKISREEALDRFVRAARERRVQAIYLRPFLPPQIDGNPVAYNLAYFTALRDKLALAGFSIGPAQPAPALGLEVWQVLLLAAGVFAGAVFLLDLFVPLHGAIMLFLFLVPCLTLATLDIPAHQLPIQKLLAWLSAVVFPSYAVIATFGRDRKPSNRIFYDSLMAVINVLAETSLGIFLMVGLLADYRFLSGVEVFPAVKAALVLPVVLVSLYFLKIKNIRELLESKITVRNALLGLLALGTLGLLVARSGNFTLPVPGFEKYFRNWLEMLLYIRPRTKEFLVGYPLLFLSAYYYFKGQRQWLWLLAALGAIAPISVFNSFSHIHTPLMVSVLRTFNGLALGIIVSLIAGWLAQKYWRAE